MLQILVIVVSALALVSLVGLVPLAWLRPADRQRFAPALPALGAMTLVVVMHWPVAVMPADSAFVLALPLLLVAGVLGVRARGRELPVEGLRTAALLLVLATIGAWIALLPLLRVGAPRLVQPTLNNDAFAYVTVSAWLEEHDALEVPTLADDPPGFAYAAAHLDHGLRIGEELLQVAVATANGRDPASTYYPVAVMITMLMPGAYAVAARLLGVRRGVAGVAGVAIAGSGIVITQVFNQNSAALLGIVFAPLALASLVSTLFQPEGERPPLWLTAMSFAALIGSYAEYMPVIGLAVVALVVGGVARGPRGSVAGRARTVALLGALAVAAAPLAWFNAARSLLMESGVTAPGVKSAFLGIPAWAVVNRVLGAAAFDEVHGVGADTVMLLAIVVGGLAAVLLLDPHRWVWSALLVGSSATIVYLSTIHYFPYGQQRALQIAAPLVLLGAFAGVDRLARRLRLAPWVAAAVILPFIVVNLAGQHRWQRTLSVDRRHIDTATLEAAGWVEDLAGPDGDDAVVATSSFFEQLWLSYELRDREETEWAFLYPDYLGGSLYDRWDGEIPPFMLVSRLDWIDVDPEAIVRENHRFQLLDLRNHAGVVAMPTFNFWGFENGPVGPAQWMRNDGELFLIRGPGGPDSVEVRVSPNGALGPMTLTVTGPAGAVSAPLSADTVLEVPMPQLTARLTLTTDPRGGPIPGKDPRDLAVYLIDVARG